MDSFGFGSLEVVSCSNSPRPDDITFKRIPDLYFTDGNIILEAGTTHFRVYSSVLAARSPVFMDVLSLPKSNEDGEEVNGQVDGCSVIHLAGDDPDEVASFLRAIFDSRSVQK